MALLSCLGAVVSDMSTLRQVHRGDVAEMDWLSQWRYSLVWVLWSLI